MESSKCLTKGLAAEPSMLGQIPPTCSLLPATWDKQLPDDILEIIFQNLCIGDRFRMKLVCKSWKRVLTQEHIPRVLEAPWEILSDDSYSNPEPFLTEIRFKSLSEDRIYRFNLPQGLGHDRFWCCGSSRGWLLIAAGHKLDPDMLLWNPLSGAIQELPPLYTHPTFDAYQAAVHWGVVENISTFIERVEVFSVGSVECVVAVICHEYEGHNQIALCSPQEKAWTVFGGGGGGGGDDHADKIFYSDIMFHNKSGLLCALAIDVSLDGGAKNLLNKLHLTGCEVNLCTVFVKNIDHTDVLDYEFPPFGFGIVKGQTHVMRFVEDSIIDGNLLILIIGLDCLVSVNPAGSIGPVKSFRCHQTTRMMVQMASRKPSLEVLTSIGDQAIFLGVTGSFAVPCPARGVEADCVYFAIDHALGVFDSEFYIVREHGVFFMKRNLLQRTSFKNVRYPLQSKIGWFAPKLF